MLHETLEVKDGLSKHERLAIIEVHFKCFDSYTDDSMEAAEYLYSCLLSAELSKEMGRFDLSQFVSE